MKSQFKRSIAATALVAFGAVGLAEAVFAGDVPNGRPFQYLHRRIDALQVQIDALIGDVNNLKEWRIAAEEALRTLREDVDANKEAIALLEAELANVKSILETKQDILTGDCPEGQLVAGISQNPATLVCRADMGASGLALETVMVAVSVPANDSRVVSAECADGTVVMGGSHEAGPGLDITSSAIDGNGFTVDAANTTVDAINLNVTATCLGVAAP